MKKLFIFAMVTVLSFAFVGASTATEVEECGTGTPGYWVNHPDDWPIPGISIGKDIYFPKDLAILYMKAPVKGDKSLTLFPAYVAAVLNVKNCSPEVPKPVCPALTQCYFDKDNDVNVCDPLGQASLWLEEFGVGSGVSANSEAWQDSHGEEIYFCLDDYNNGWLNVPSRDSLE